MLDILRGLKFIHASDEVHRDLKPANSTLNHIPQVIIVLFSEVDVCWKITDFGFSSPATSVSSASGLQSEAGRGTSSYGAPELLFDNCTYSRKVDIWGVGCIFFEVITRVKAFASDMSILDYSRSHGRLRVPYLDYHFVDSLQFCEETLQRALARKPKKRPTAEKLIIYLEDFLDHLEYGSPRDEDITARPLHSRQGRIDIQPNDVITPPRSDAEPLIARPIFIKSESADDWSDGEWTEHPPPRHYTYQCEECQRHTRIVTALQKA
jgi:serine/threonine protein kinase